MHAPLPADDAFADYVPVVCTRRRAGGWTADRQRLFLTALAETGCVSEACDHAGITARSAYRLRAHADGATFAAAWDQALRSAAGKLVTIAYERALRGSIREMWRDGKLVAEMRQPSDTLLMFLLERFAPANDSRWSRWSMIGDMAGKAGGALAGSLDALVDSAVTADLLGAADYEATPPLHAIAPPRAPGADE